MYWIRSLLLALLTSACCLSAISVWKVLDSQRVRRENLKHNSSEKSASSVSLRWKSEGTPQFLVVEPSLGETNQLESNKQKTDKQLKETSQIESNKQKTIDKQPAETGQLESNKQKTTDKQPAETDQLESNKQKTTDKQPAETHFTVKNHRESFVTNAGSSPGIVLTGTPTKDHFKETSPSLDSRYPTDYIDNEGGVRNGAPSEESDQRLDTERGASSEEIDQRLDTERGASSEESDQRLDTERESMDANCGVSELKGHISKSSYNIFPCAPCTCKHTPNSFVAADCAQLGLEKFPLNLPSETISIDLSFNRLLSLDTSSFLGYRYLEKVTLASNQMLDNVAQSSIGEQRSNVKVLNLTSCNIKTFQVASFNVTPNLTHLIISHNALEDLTTSTFNGLGKLLHLDLSVNKLSSLKVGTFDDLTELLSLDLSKNRQLGYSEKQFPPLLFKNLKKLQKLSINSFSNNQSSTYPSRTLQDLVELRELSVDGLRNPAEFGPEMKTLDKLVSLEIRGHFKDMFKNITETFFQNIPNLTSFKMDRCYFFWHVHPKAYTKLARLQTLSISNMTYYKLETAFHDLTGLNNSPLNSITFSRLRRPDHEYRYLGHKFSRYLHNFSLVYLDLSWNFIYLMGTDFLNELPTTLRTFILTGNKFTSETLSINGLSVLNSLTELDLSMQIIGARYDHSDLSLEDSRICKPTRQLPSFCEEPGRHNDLALDGSHNFEIETDATTTCLNQSSKMTQPNTSSKIPPNLRILKASWYPTFGMHLLKNLYPRNNSLSVVDFTNSLMVNWGSHRLPPGITFANLGDNYCTKIKHDFFRINNSHRQLLLNKNFLGPDFANDTEGKIFSNLSKTVCLDISTNLIYSIPKSLFSGLSSLKYLNLSDNKLTMLNASFGHMKTLEFIDFSKNWINWIDAETRNDLDTIASSPKHHLTIDLTLNFLPCTCDGLELISWMATTKVLFHKEHLLTCSPDNKVVEPMGDLEKRRQQLQRLCMSKSLFIIGCSAALTVVMVIVSLGLMYRYRWKLRYLHNTAMATMFGFKPEVSQQSGCTFDAYFVYTTDARDFVLDKCLKELEVNRGHRLCVEDRDFLAGTYIVSSIVSAVRNSTKTVVVLTPDFKEEPYCEYSFKMAVMEELYKQRTVLHLLLYQPVASHQMSYDELSLMKRNSYIEYPPDGGADEGVRRAFWDELSEVICHSGNETAEPVLDME